MVSETVGPLVTALAKQFASASEAGVLCCERFDGLASFRRLGMFW
jgi:hypothetical protein